MSGEFLRKASKDLMPSESPFFSLKALSSSPWSAKPFMRTLYAHRAFSVTLNAYSGAFNELKIIISKMTARLFFDIGAQPYEHRGTRPSRNLRSNSYFVQGAFTMGFRHHNLRPGFSTYESIIVLDLCRFIEHSRSDFDVKYVQEGGGSS